MDTKQFLENFPSHVFRYIDQTGNGRPPVSSRTINPDLNERGYESYFTAGGGFADDTDNQRIESLTSINAFFVDIDGRKDDAEIESIKARLCPTFIIETMRGYHLYWLLDEPIYKNEVTDEEWNEALAKWAAVEQALVTGLGGDPAVKDVTRILRVPDTYYWKKSGDAYLEGVDHAPFRIALIFSDPSKRYSMDHMAESFAGADPEPERIEAVRQASSDDFFARVNAKYPIEDRPSYKALVSGDPSSLPPRDPSRNAALLVTASLSRMAGIDPNDLYRDIVATGWHGMAKERGGLLEIRRTIESAYRGGYTYGRSNPYVEHNMTDEERRKLADTYAAVTKDRKELDKLRYSTYENELFERHPHLKRNEAGIMFEYRDGVYVMLNREELNKLVLDAMYEDNLWSYRTGKCVADKVMCLSTLLPLLVETDDPETLNVRNGLLNIYTLKLSPHTPDFVTLIQLPVEYKPHATCPTWLLAMAAWTQGDEQEAKTNVLQEFAGYCLSSSTKQAKALFLIGDGGNGKSTYADTIGMLIGDRATSRISLEEIYTQFGMAGLIGKRLNIIEEISSNYFHGHKIKSLISGEETTAAIKYKDSFKFKPEAKYIFAVNMMPRVDDASSGMERRILAINFRNNFRENPNVNLRFGKGLLAKELPGILNWALEGAKRLADNGKFTETKEKDEIIKDYREENSSVDGFIGECFEDCQGSVMNMGDLYDVYRTFCQRDGRTPKAKIGFTKELKMHGHRTHRFSILPRRYGADESRIEGIKLGPKWERNTIGTFIPDYE